MMTTCSTSPAQTGNRRAFSSLLLADQRRDFASRCQFTPREIEIVELVGCGLNNGELCEELRISHATLRSHLRAVYAKTACKNRVALILMMVQKYLREPMESAQADTNGGAARRGDELRISCGAEYDQVSAASDVQPSQAH